MINENWNVTKEKDDTHEGSSVFYAYTSITTPRY